MFVFWWAQESLREKSAIERIALGSVVRVRKQLPQGAKLGQGDQGPWKCGSYEFHGEGLQGMGEKMGVQLR